MSTEAIVVLCTAPNEDTAARLARGLVEQRLAACVNVIGGLRSFYRWQDKVEDEREVQMVIKTERRRFDAVAAFIRAEHPYTVPELLALPVLLGSEPYLEWLRAETNRV